MSVLSFFLFLVIVRDVQAQQIVPEFTVDIVSARSNTRPDLARVDVYTKIAYPRLSFINTPNGFKANYEVTFSAIEIKDGDRLRNLVTSRIWESGIVTDTYAHTQEPDRTDRTTQSIDLPPGEYILDFEFADKNSKLTYLREIPVDIRSMNGPVALSDITLLESYNSKTYDIVPKVEHFVSTTEGGFQIFYEVYSDQAIESRVKREIFRALSDGTVSDEASLGQPEGALGEAVFAQSEDLSLSAGTTQQLVTIPLEEMNVGSYILRISIENDAGMVLDSTQLAFSAEWNGLSAHIKDIEQAISQLAYIAKKKDLNYIKDAPNDVERFQRFRTFWDKRDPTPGTKRNEKMEEYYYRVNSANQHYGAVQEGWKTDRGFVFVRFGEPDHIERKPHSFNYEPYEIWIYERIGRQFIFVDKTGFGDYQLLVPVWDERTRLY